MKRRGFTIVEMLVASALILIAVTIAYNSYVFAKDAWLYLSVQGRMQSDGMLAMERMIHGIDANLKGIHEAQGIITPTPGNSGSSIEFVDGVDPTLSRLFYLSDDKVVYMDESNNTSDLIDQGVQSLTFTRPAGSDDLVVINLIQQRTAFNKTINVELNTSVRVRNM